MSMVSVFDRAEALSRIEQIARVVTRDKALVLTETTPLGDQSDWTSLTNLEILMEVEEQFGVDLDVEDFGELQTVAQLVDRLEAALN